MKEIKRPPLGVMPKHLWLEQFEEGCIPPEDEVKKRLEAVKGAITRCLNENYHIRSEWIEEYEMLIKYFEEVKK